MEAFKRLRAAFRVLTEPPWGMPAGSYEDAAFLTKLGAQASRIPSLALDAYLWLAYWLHTLKASASVCWQMSPSAARASNEVGEPMPFKPNYNQQRNERNRAKEQRKQEKLQRREEEAAKRKAAGEEGQSSPAGPETSQDT